MGDRIMKRLIHRVIAIAASSDWQWALDRLERGWKSLAVECGREGDRKGVSLVVIGIRLHAEEARDQFVSDNHITHAA